MDNYNNQDYEGTCPHCGIGRVQAKRRPYIEVYQGHLFTLPQARCYVCDVCEFAEFDTADVSLISEIVLETSSQTRPTQEDIPLHQSTKSDDDIITKRLRPSASS